MRTLVLLLGVTRHGGRGVIVDRKVEVGRSWNVFRRFFWISVAEFSGDAEGVSRIETSDNQDHKKAKLGCVCWPGRGTSVLAASFSWCAQYEEFLPGW